MPNDAIIKPENVKLEVEFPSAISSILPPATSQPGVPNTVRFSFGPRDKAVVKMKGSVQAGLFAKDDRARCDLEFMQFATPARIEKVYIGLLNGITTLSLAPHIRNTEFLDTPTNATSDDLLPKHGVFMSETPHKANETRDGHFINSMIDHPGFGTPDFLVADNNELNFLQRVSYLVNFATLLVFVQPNGRRQPVALVRWTTTYEFDARWRGGRLSSLFGKGSMQPGAVVTESNTVKDFTARVNQPLGLVINQVMAPTLVKQLVNTTFPGPTERSFVPLPHTALAGGFWTL